MNYNKQSIFTQMYSKEIFIDKYILDKTKGIDVIIPLISINEFFYNNLLSFYREIPINSLIIGLGLYNENIINILKNFPRIVIINQEKNKTLGYCLKELINNVNTEFFIYLHSDIYLPSNWFNKMIKYTDKYDFFECHRRKLLMIDYLDQKQFLSERAFSGSQIGNTEILKNIVSQIKDDFIYRNEDIIIQELLLKNNFKYGKIIDTFHYHQIINKNNNKTSNNIIIPNFNKAKIYREYNEKWIIDTSLKQLKGIIKYLNPDKNYLIDIVNSNLKILINLNKINIKILKNWINKINPLWLNYIKFKDKSYIKIFRKIIKYFKKCLN